MKISRNWLQKYFDKEIPKTEELAELFTFHSFEIEGLEDFKDENGKVIDSVIDAKILPDRAHYCLSHKGIAEEVAVLTGQNLDGAVKQRAEKSVEKTIEKTIETKPNIVIENPNFCRRYIGRYVENINITQSPQWVKDLLNAIGQRAIASIVDATNYCMFDIGQPLHAFDADKVEGDIVVRSAQAGERITLLDNSEIDLTTDDYIIADRKGPLAIAGVKGGKRAEVTNSTTKIIIESANFNPTSVRRTSTKYNLRSESSKRYENEITPELAIEGINNVCALIQEMNPTAKFGPIVDIYPNQPKSKTVIDFNAGLIEERLGVDVPLNMARKILGMMNIEVEEIKTPNENLQGNIWRLSIPFNRFDLTLPEDVVEEIGRVYGYEHIKGVLPPLPTQKLSDTSSFTLGQVMRQIFSDDGYSEVSLYSLVEKGDIETAKPLAKDKAFARGNLTDGLILCLEKNAINSDFINQATIKIFEIGRVFEKTGERISLGLGVIMTKKIKGQTSEKILRQCLEKLACDLPSFYQSINIAGIQEVKIIAKNNYAVCEIDISEILKSLTDDSFKRNLAIQPSSNNRYEKISSYPYIVRDIAVFVPESVQAEDVWQSIDKTLNLDGARELLVKHMLFDTFKKDGKISYAFRMIFQSMERTLTDNEANKIMNNVYDVIKENGWQVR